MSPSSKARQFTIRRGCFGIPVLYVRVSAPLWVPGEWKWGKWKRAGLAAQALALVKLRELNID